MFMKFDNFLYEIETIAAQLILFRRSAISKRSMKRNKGQSGTSTGEQKRQIITNYGLESPVTVW